MIIPEKLRQEIDACPSCRRNKTMLPKAADAFCEYHGAMVFGDRPLLDVLQEAVIDSTRRIAKHMGIYDGR